MLRNNLQIKLKNWEKEPNENLALGRTQCLLRYV